MFTVGTPDGQMFEVDAPDAASAASAMEQMLAGSGKPGMALKSRNAQRVLPDRFYDDQHMQMYNEQPFMEDRPTIFPEQHPDYGTPRERRGQPVGGRGDVVAGGGGQNAMQGGNAQDVPQRPGSMRFDHLIPGGGQQQPAPLDGEQPPAQQRGAMRFDHIGVSRGTQMDQAFNPKTEQRSAPSSPRPWMRGSMLKMTCAAHGRRPAMLFPWASVTRCSAPWSAASCGRRAVRSRKATTP